MLVLLPLTVWQWRIGKKTQGNRTHIVLAFLLFCVGVSTVSIFLRLIHFTAFSSDGIGMPGLDDFTGLVNYRLSLHLASTHQTEFLLAALFPPV
jgi:hypothetical protein